MKIYFKGTGVHNDPKFYLGNVKIDLTNTSKENPLEVADDVGAKLCGDLPNLIFKVEEPVGQELPKEVFDEMVKTAEKHKIEMPEKIIVPLRNEIVKKELLKEKALKPKVYIVTARGHGKRGLKDGGLLDKGKKFNAISKSVRSIPQMLMWEWIIEYKE